MINVKLIIFTLVIVGLLSIFYAFRADSNQEYDFCLRKSYQYYKLSFMSKDGRIMDPDKNNITTSEGQSYIMLRSLAIGDKATFDLAYKWTKDNLQRKDKLFAWLWGKDKDGEYKILDNNSAADADVDIAFALILAYEKWGQYHYLVEAVPIAQSIWDNETKKVGEYLVLMPGAQQTLNEIIEVNPSYFSPYAFRFFQKYDDLHDWNCLIDSSYHYLMEDSSKTKTKLPSNWFYIENGEVLLDDSEKSDFSYDAVRCFVRVYLDYLRTGEKRALPFLEKSKFFATHWKSSGKFYTNYKSNGELRNYIEYLGSIAIITPVISMYEPDTASEIYKLKLDKYFNDPTYWELKKDYYGKNLAWFGCYLYNKKSREYKSMHNRRIIDY